MQVFISYVRKEGEKYARDLKNALNYYNVDVYLDVDEIRPGNNWQDDLNNAIIECDMFVALITPNYGKTKWTKREIQLGDDLNKHIFPINFLDHWPPLAIAINLLATHYLPWKIDDDIKENKGSRYRQQTCDDTISDESCVHKIAKEIVNTMNKSNILTSN